MNKVKFLRVHNWNQENSEMPKKISWAQLHVIQFMWKTVRAVDCIRERLISI